MKIALKLGIVFVLLACFGCARSQPAAEGDRQASSPTTAVTEETLRPVEIRVGDETDLARLLEENRGKVVLVDFWATWCPPCMELLPHTLEMAKKYSARDLAVILVAINDPKEQAEDVKAVLERNQASGVVNLICRYGIGPEAVESFEIDDGALPHLRLYDREGRLQAKFGVSAIAPDPKRIEAEVERLLAAPEEAASHEPTTGPELVIPEGPSSSTS